jgi:dTDP-4-amino-4,6-dideoxygalactose transaminase
MDDIVAVSRVLKNGVLTANKRREREVDQFEAEYAAYTGAEHCVATQSGTSALHACMAAIGVQPGDEVIVPALTFLASAASIIHHQGIPVFADIDPVTFNIDPESIEQKITPRTKAIVAVHLHGLPADMDRIREIADRHGLVLVEDASHAHGSYYKGRMAGSIGDVAGASLMADKNLAACGEAGAFTTSDESMKRSAEIVRMFGESPDEDEGDRTYLSYTLGWNYRMSPIQAAFLRSQLTRLDDDNETRRRNAGILSDGLAEIPGLVPPHVPEDRIPNFHMYRFSIDTDAMGVDVPVGRIRKALQMLLLAEGVPAREWQNVPLPGHPLFQRQEGYGDGCPWTCKGSGKLAYSIEDYPVALSVIESSLVFAREIRCPAGPEVYQAYVGAFQKVFENMDTLIDTARALDYRQPWESKVRLS